MLAIGKQGCFPHAGVADYSVQIQHGGEPRWLGTANKKDAAARSQTVSGRARQRLEVVMRQRRRDPATKKVNVTIGECIEAVAAKISFSEDVEELRAGAAQNHGRHYRRDKARTARFRQTAHAHPRRSKRGELNSSARRQPTHSKRRAPVSQLAACSCGRVHSSAPRLWHGFATSWKSLNRYLSTVSKLRACLCHATEARSISWRCSKARGRSWPRLSLKDTRSSCLASWRAFAGTKLTCCHGLRFAGTKA